MTQTAKRAGCGVSPLDFLVTIKYNGVMEARKGKARMGRPPKKPADRLSECIMVRVTKAERRRLQEEAERLGIPLAALLMLPWRKTQQ